MTIYRLLKWWMHITVEADIVHYVNISQNKCLNKQDWILLFYVLIFQSTAVCGTTNQKTTKTDICEGKPLKT